MRKLLLIVIMVFPQISLAEVENTCDEFGAKLMECADYSCQMPYPKDREFRVEHTIGRNENNPEYCHHTQTVPGGMVECNYSEVTRKTLAKTHDKDYRPTDEDNEIIKLAFKIECEYKGGG